jgi:hypothetical protein
VYVVDEISTVSDAELRHETARVGAVSGKFGVIDEFGIAIG